VDSDEEFNPARVNPIEGLPSDRFNILFPGRLAEQKDPALMVDVMRQVIKMQQEGPCSCRGRRPIGASSYERSCAMRVLKVILLSILQGRELARWYSACDMLLMTSVFEGVPYVVYEGDGDAATDRCACAARSISSSWRKQLVYWSTLAMMSHSMAEAINALISNQELARAQG